MPFRLQLCSLHQTFANRLTGVAVVGVCSVRGSCLCFRYYDPEYKRPNHERVLCERVTPPLPDLEPKFVIFGPHTCAMGKFAYCGAGVSSVVLTRLFRGAACLLCSCWSSARPSHSSLTKSNPFFCSFALYDLGKRTKISEKFYFDRNQQSILSQLGRHLVRSAFFAYQLFSAPLRPPDSSLSRDPARLRRSPSTPHLVSAGPVLSVAAQQRGAGVRGQGDLLLLRSCVNNLYVYPESAVLSAHNRKVKVR